MEELRATPLKSPKEDLELSLTGDKSIIIKDSKGSTLARTSFKSRVANVLWSGDQQSVLIMTIDDTINNSVSHIYRYSLKNNKQEIIADNALYDWNTVKIPNQYVICREKSNELTDQTIYSSSVREPSSIIFLDAKTLMKVFTSGQNCGDYTLSSDAKCIAYIQLVKDKYGDYYRIDLKVANIRVGKVMNPAYGWRPLKYIWADSKSIIYVEPNKYDLLSIRKFNIDTGKKKTFISDLSVPAIKLDAYDKKTGILYYKVLDTHLSSTDDPVTWAVSLGRKPISSEQKSFPKPKSEAVQGLMMGLPGMMPPPNGAEK